MLTVMVVDQDPYLRRSLRNAVECMPGTRVVSEAGDALEALRMCEKFRPECVFIDIDLPGRKGLGLARQIKGINPGAHIVFCSDSIDYRRRVAELCSCDYLFKPIREDLLKKTIARIMGAKNKEQRCCGSA